MIILRQNCFSMIDNITNKLDREGIEDYGTDSSIPNDVISITTNLQDLKIYFPPDFEYSQYDIDDFIRSMVPYMRTTTILDRNIYVMKLSGKLNETQYYKLVKFIIKSEGSIVLIEEED